MGSYSEILIDEYPYVCGKIRSPVMNTIAEFRLPAENFALHETLSTTDIDFEAERVTAHDSHRVLPLLWAAGPPEDLDGVEAALRDDPSVEDVELVTELDNEQLYQMKWVKNIRFIVHILVEEQAIVFSASGSRSHWDFRVLFPDREAVGATHDFCEDWDLGVTLRNVFEMSRERYGRFGLTKEQSEILVVALERGFYDIPQKAYLNDLADDLDISRQAASERLRRAYKKVIQDTMTIGHNGGETRNDR